MTKKIFRKLLSTMMLLVMTSLAFAADITGTGTGTTKDEAINNARRDCLSQITINISMSTITESHDDGSFHSASLSQYSYQYTTFDIIGAREEVTQSKGVYTAKTTIPEEAAPLYETKVRDLLNETDTLYRTLLGRESMTSIDELCQLSITVRDFEIYRTVLQKLNPNNPYATKNAAITKTAADTLYRNRLMQEQNLQEQTMEDLNTRIQMGMADAETKRQLEEVKKAYEATLAEQKAVQEQAKREQRQRFAEFEQMTIIAMENTANRISSIENESTNTLLASMFNRIEANRKTLRAIKDNLIFELNSLEKEMKNKKIQSNTEIAKMPYSSSDYINGSLTQEARRYRETLKSTTAKEIENEYGILERTLINRYVFNMEELATKNRKLIEKLKESRYSFSTGDPGVSVKCDGMYLENGIISFTFTIVLGDKTIQYYYTISYQDITGKKRPDMSSPEYSVYRDELMQIYNVLKDYPDFYPVTIEIFVKPDGPSRYSCLMTACDIYIDVGKGYKGTSSFNRQQEEFISFDDSVEFGNYRWLLKYSSLLDAEAVAKEAQSQYARQQEQKEGITKRKDISERSQYNNSSPSFDKTNISAENGQNDLTQGVHEVAKTKKKGENRTGKIAVLLDYAYLDGGKSRQYEGHNLSAGISYWQNNNIYHSCFMTTENLPNIRQPYINKEGEIFKNATSLGIFGGYCIGFAGPDTGILKLDATVGIRLGGENFETYSEPIRYEEINHSFVMCTDLTCGMTLRLGDPYKMGIQIKGYGILSFNTISGIRKGFGINFHFAPME